MHWAIALHSGLPDLCYNHMTGLDPDLYTYMETQNDWLN